MGGSDDQTPPSIVTPAPSWWARTSDGIWDVIVVGGGHAGVEAAHAAGRMGARVLLVTADLTTIASMPCNPSVGGPAKGHLVREIDALGGLMGRAADRTASQIRMLNTGKGPAVRALRAQVDKHRYADVVAGALTSMPSIERRAGIVHGFVLEGDPSPDPSRRPICVGVVTTTGDRYAARSVIVTTGTFLDGRLIRGEVVTSGGRFGEASVTGLSSALAALGLTLARHKTGTPPRIDAASIDFAFTETQCGSDVPLGFAHEPVEPADRVAGVPHAAYPDVDPNGWRVQIPAYLVHTTTATHDVIRANLDRAPIHNGGITAPGPRYCPSLEAKITRFADKERHQLFLEPEGFDTPWVYVQGANTSLPDDVQADLLATIPALASARILRPGYAVEYNYVPADQIWPTLETRVVAGLFLAGQINGTSGYEEAGAQGLMAGVNATLRARSLRNHGPVCDATWTPWRLSRTQAYLGVLLDDLTSMVHEEPYRLHTARAEYRLLLRHDNADLRLTPDAVRLGLVPATRAVAVEARRDRIASLLQDLTRRPVVPAHNVALRAYGFPEVTRPTTARDYLCRPDVHLGFLAVLGADAMPDAIDDDLAAQIEVATKYEGYVRRQEVEVARTAQMEEVGIPTSVNFGAMLGLRTEARERLARFRPLTVGQASRIAGVTPADVAVLMVRLRTK